MIYVFDTSALIWVFESAADGARWMSRIPSSATIFYHPITLAEIAAQTHEGYVASRRTNPSPAELSRIVENRRQLLIALAHPKARPQWLRRNFRVFDTSTRPSNHSQPSVYAQLQYEKGLKHYLYKTRTGEVRVLASMVDHMILAVASFLRCDGAQLAAFVTRDRQLYEAADRVGVPKLFASTTPHRPTGGSWI